MPKCSRCECAELLPSNGPWWLGRVCAQLFNVAQCAKCKRYVNGCSGRPVLPLVYATLTTQSIGIILIVVLGCIGELRGGSIELWFGIPLVLFLGLSCAWVLWIARTQH